MNSSLLPLNIGPHTTSSRPSRFRELRIMPRMYGSHPEHPTAPIDWNTEPLADSHRRALLEGLWHLRQALLRLPRWSLVGLGACARAVPPARRET
jgi:hypothetical protein